MDLNAGTLAQIDEILKQAMLMVGADFGNLQIMDEGDHLRMVAAHGFDRTFVEQFRLIPPDAGTACTRAFLSRGPVIVADVETDPEFAPFRDCFRRAGFRAVRSAPLPDAKGVPFGVISTHWRAPRAVVEWETEMLRLQGREVARRVELLVRP